MSQLLLVKSAVLLVCYCSHCSCSFLPLLLYFFCFCLYWNVKGLGQERLNPLSDDKVRSELPPPPYFFFFKDTSSSLMLFWDESHIWVCGKQQPDGDWTVSTVTAEAEVIYRSITEGSVLPYELLHGNMLNKISWKMLTFWLKKSHHKVISANDQCYRNQKRKKKKNKVSQL